MSHQEQGPCCFAVIDDEPSFTRLVSDMLSSCGAKVEIFMGGLDLLKESDLMQYKAIVLDLSLPDIDGFDLMQELASKAKGISLVLMSGHNIEIVSAAKIYGNALGLNVRAALTKPFTRNELFAALGLLA